MALAANNPIKILVVDRSFCNFVNVHIDLILDSIVNISSFSKVSKIGNEKRFKCEDIGLLLKNTKLQENYDMVTC